MYRFLYIKKKSQGQTKPEQK